MTFETRKRWENDAKNQQIYPLRTYTPNSIEELRCIVAVARDLDYRVRASGSQHSWSDAAMTPDFMVLPTGLDQPLPLSEDVLKPPQLPAGNALVEIESGITLRALNEYLNARGLALPNMGGYDGQTIAGVTATSTHGSGITFGPLPEIIRSMDVVDGRSNILRIERTDGPTDPVRYSTKYGTGRTLIQDDTVFYSLGVGLGSIALVYSMIIEVVPAFWLKEVRRPTTWEIERENLRKDEIFRHLHYELLLNPYAIDGSHTCLVTNREETPPPVDLPPDRTHRNFFEELLASLPITIDLLPAFFNIDPDSTPKKVNGGILALADNDGYTNRSYKVFNIGAANGLPALSAEYAVDISGGLFIDAVDAVLGVAGEAAAAGRIYQSGPIAVRFVRGTQFLLSPQFGRDTAMIECIAVNGAIGAAEMLYQYEEAVRGFGGRPHWGQLNHISADQVAGMYPGVNEWKQVRSQLDPERRFDGPLTRRAGL